jgi:SAM-dependent methyltransferase
MFMNLFDLQAYQLKQKRAQQSYHKHAFLFNHIGDELTSRLQDIKRNFKNSLNLSPHPLKDINHQNTTMSEILDYRDDTFDMIVSCLSLQWVNNLPKFINEIQRCLVADGLFMGALLGGNTLSELRESLLKAEISLKGGASPRVSPMLHPSDAATLMQKSGFLLPVIDLDRIHVTYPSLDALMKDLRGMGATNCLSDRQRSFTSFSLFHTAEALYKNHYGDSTGHLPATFEIIYLTGWKNPQA